MENKVIDFVSLERLFEVIPMTDDEAEVFERYTCDYDFTSVEEQGPEWIFSLLSVMRSELARDEIGLEDYDLLNHVFIRILEWLIEGSGYLKYYDGVKLNDARMQVERFLDEAIAGREAARLIHDGDDGKYIMEKLGKLTISGYLYKKSLVWITILTIVRLSSKLHLLPVQGLVLLVYHTLNKGCPKILDCFNARVKLVRERDDKLCFDGYSEDQLRETVWILGARILLGESVQEELACLRSMFFRYLYVLLDKEETSIRENAFNSLLFNQKTALFTWEDLLTFSIPELAEAIAGKTMEALRNCQRRLFEGYGQVLVENKAITINSPGVSNFVPLLDVEGVALRVGTGRDKLNFEEELTAVVNSWRSVYADFSDELKKNIIRKRRPVEGTVVNIRVKLVYNMKPTLAFVSIVDDQYEGDGALHVSQITRAKLDSLEDILQPGDIMTATVIEAEDGRLRFSIWEQLGRFSVGNVQEGERCNALLLNERNGILTWLAEAGFIVYTRTSEMFDVEEGDYCLLELIPVPSFGKINGNIVQLQAEGFDRYDAVAHLIRGYVESCKKGKQVEGPENFNTGKIERSTDVSGKYVKELIRLLQLYLTREVNLQNLNLLYYLRLLAHVLGDNRLKGYYECLINHLIVKYEFISGNLHDMDLGALEKDFRTFPALEPQWAIVKMLALYGDASRANDIVRYSHSDNEYLAKVAKFVLAGEVKSESSGGACIVQDELLDLLLGAQESGVITDKTCKFKNSIVYTDGVRGVDVEKQIDSVMQDICDYLNDEGGLIYIGVNNKGVPVGVQADLDYLCCNQDKYELFLHKRIVEAFDKEIDKAIKIDRKQFGDKIVFVLSVPPSHQLVEYHSTI